MLLDIVVSTLDIVFLALLLLIVRFYIQPEASGTLSFLPAWIINRSSAWLIAAFLLLFGIKNIFAFLVTRSNFSFINRVAIRISLNNINSYQQVSFNEFVHTDSSVFIRNICYRPFEFSQYMLSGFQQIVTQLTLMLIALIAIILFNAKIFLLLLLLLLPPVVIVFWFIKKRMAGQKKSIQENNELSFRYVLDALKGYVESNVYDRNSFFSSRFINARQKFSNALFGSLALQNLPGRIIEIFAILGLFILIVIANRAGNNNDMLITIGAFMAAAYKIIPGIVKIINVSGQMKTYESSVHDMEANKDQVPEKTAAKQRLPLSSIQLKNITFAYNEKRVLHNFSININKGDFIGITGESGKGKTTLINLLLGFLQPASGEIYFNNQPLTGQMIKQYWPSVTYVRQQNFLIHDTLLKNIILEEELANPEQLQVALNVSGLAEMIEAYSEGIEKVVTENGKNISGGQQQRISIARALYKNADLILLDEPFNELDAATAQSLLQHFNKLAAAGKAVMMITHNKESLKYCNKIVSVDKH